MMVANDACCVMRDDGSGRIAHKRVSTD